MELTLKRLLEHAEFKKYRGKGYDPAEVDDFLDRAAAMAGKVEVQLTQALDAAKAGGAPDASAIEAEIDRRVAQRIAEMPPPEPAASSGPSEEETAEEVRRTIIMAQRTADAAVREAREDADKILAAANEQAQTLVADAEARAAALRTDTEEHAARVRDEVEEEATRERREARQRLASEIAELEGVRESLRSDVSVLERHVEEQRTQLGSTLAELQQILDDPSGFRLAPPPALSDHELPDFSDLDEAPPSASEPVDAAEEPPAPEPVAEAPAPAPGPADPEPEPDPEPVAQVEPEPELAAPAEVPVDEAEEDGGPPPIDAPSASTSTPQPLNFADVDHAAPGVEDPFDGGPPTAPVSAIDLGIAPVAPEAPRSDEDPFLAELRKAMADDEPLGPRDQEPPTAGDGLFDDDDRRGWRLGRRR